MKPKKKWKPNEIIEILDEAYARPPQQVSRDPMFELILTVLSQHTSDHNSGEAMHRLLEKFPSWELILSSDVAELEEAIRPGGLAPTKSKRITYILREIADRNDSFDLSFLEFMPLTEARDCLLYTSPSPRD